MGFLVVDELARRWKATLELQVRFEGLLGDATVGDERVLLLKPLTYMNLSGRSVGGVLRYYKLACEAALVIYDELDLPLGKLRVRASGSAGGHRGMVDVIRHLGTEDVARIRIGIGRGASHAVDHVLGGFRADERPAAEQAVARGADAAECWVRRGVTAAMNEFNAMREGA